MTDIQPPVKKDARTFLKKFADGFLAETRPPVALPDPAVGGVGTEDDLLDYASLDMVQASRIQDAGGDGDREAEPLRTISGTLDFLGGVFEEALDAMVERENGDAHVMPGPKDSGYVLRTSEVAARSWKGTRFTVPISGADIQLVRKDHTRKTVLIVNHGPSLVWISDESGIGVGARPNSFTVPISFTDGVLGEYLPIRINTQDEIWAHGDGVGIATVEVLTTFGLPEENDY
jgi:hypothetical protein